MKVLRGCRFEAQQEPVTIGGVISDAAEYVGSAEIKDGLEDTPLARRLIAAGVAFEQLLCVAIVAQALARPGGTTDATLLRDLRKALDAAAPVMANEHYSRMAREVQQVAA